MTLPYDISDYKNPLFTIDNVLFTVDKNALKVLLVKRASEPFKDAWGLPGGFVDIEQDADTNATALRKLKEKTSVIPPYLEQLKVFSGLTRDPRGFSATLVYFALVQAQTVQSFIDTVDDVKWVEMSAIQAIDIAFDHEHIIEQAQQRLVQKSLYSMLPVYCLPEQFTVSELKTVIEVIIGKSVQRKSLLRRMEASGMFETMTEKVKSGGRKAQMYRLIDGASILNFERNLVI